MASHRHDAVRYAEFYTHIVDRLTRLPNTEAATAIAEIVRAIESQPQDTKARRELHIMAINNSSLWRAWMTPKRAPLFARHWVVVEEPEEAQRIVE